VSIERAVPQGAPFELLPPPTQPMLQTSSLAVVTRAAVEAPLASARRVCHLYQSPYRPLRPSDGDALAMTSSPRSLLLVLAACVLDACASAPPPPPPPQAAVERPRRRRRRAATAAAATATETAAPPTAAATDAPAATTAAPAGPPEGLSLVPTVRRVGAGSFEPRPNAPSMGSPVVQAPSAEGRPLTARWTGPRSAPRIVCEGDAVPQRPSTQSPYDPTNAMIVRAFLPVERQVLACAPPINREGRVPVRVLFSGSGLPLEVSLSSDVSRAQGLCLGAALCSVRLAAFRAPNATVNYAFVAAVAADDAPSQPE
jgi:hypothetical protein